MENRFLFRGKTLHGDWVQGFLACKGDEWYISNKAGTPFAYAVRPDTICQCTGLRDKNGRLVWEHDVLMAHLDKEYPDDITYTTVLWKDFRFVTQEDGPTKPDDLNENSFDEFEVIGNVIDNPELLKGANRDRK